ncbi:MAG: ABC transporter permease [Clostridia bacterium]|nr:ABC transporter permease [Clostridia bacterium]MBR6186359.1 ABC transporter permease [Clostridia bacterium]
MTLDKFLALGQTALELGLVNALTVLALFLSYSMLNVCDLSTDGCFTLGAAVGALVAVSGHPWLSIPAAMLAGSISGFVTATLQMRMGVQSLLAGIVVNTALYSVNMALTGNKATLPMNKTPTIFVFAKGLLKETPFAGQYVLIVMLVVVALVVLFLCFFLRTKLGLAIRATGSNADMVRSSSINPAFTTTVGLCVSNAFTALSGCLMAQQQKNYEVNMGSGMVTVALASLLIGGVFFGRHRSVPLRAVGAVLGAFLFRLVYALALRVDMPAFMLKAVSSVIVVLAISGPYLRKQLPIVVKSLQARRGMAEGGAGKC